MGNYAGLDLFGTYLEKNRSPNLLDQYQLCVKNVFIILL